LNEPRQTPDPDLLSPAIRALFAALDHAGELPDAGAGPGRVIRGDAGSEALGTRVCFALRLVQGRLAAVRYRAYGCPYTLATCEWLARQLEGCCVAGGAVEAPGMGNPLEWSERLGLPGAKLGRLLVIEDALRVALAQA
jgi:NifU-like N terminal domain